MQVGLRDLDVVAEHAVEAHLQRLDAGARALGGLELGDHLLAGAADAAQLVELGVDAVANHVAVAGQRRRLVDDRGLDGVAHVGEVVELRRPGSRTSGARHSASSSRTRGTAASDVRSATRSRGLAVDSATRDTSRSRSSTDFSVSRTLPRSAAAERQLFDGVEPLADRLERHQRRQQPGAHQPAAHRP